MVLADLRDLLIEGLAVEWGSMVAGSEQRRQEEPAERHGHDPTGGQEHLLGVQGDLETAEELHPRQHLVEVDVAHFDLVVGHAALLSSQALAPIRLGADTWA